MARVLTYAAVAVIFLINLPVSFDARADEKLSREPPVVTLAKKLEGIEAEKIRKYLAESKEREKARLKRAIVSNRRKKIGTTVRRLRKHLEALKEIKAAIPVPALKAPFQVGEFGRFHDNQFRVLNVVNESEFLAIVNYGKFKSQRVWFKGYDTSKLVSDSEFRYQGIVRVTGTKDYITVLRTKAKVVVVEGFVVRPYLPEPESKQKNQKGVRPEKDKKRGRKGGQTEKGSANRRSRINSDDRIVETTVVLRDGLDGFRGTRDVAISVDSRISHNNQGAREDIWIYQATGVSLLQFDFDYSVIPEEAIVKEASLELFVVSIGFSKEEIARPWKVGVYASGQRWREGSGTQDRVSKDGATLTTSDGAEPWLKKSLALIAREQLGTAVITGESNKRYSWKLDPRIVQSWISDTEKNYGMVLKGEEPGKAVSFFARETSRVSIRPKLRLRLAMSRFNTRRMKIVATDSFVTGIPREKLNPTTESKKRKTPSSQLDVSRQEVIAILKKHDKTYSVYRLDPVLGIPLIKLRNTKQDLDVEIFGDRHDIAQIQIAFPVADQNLKDVVSRVGLIDLSKRILPNWKSAEKWIVETIPNARRHEFKPFETTIDEQLVSLEYFAGAMHFSIQTEEWAKAKETLSAIP